MHQRVPVHRFPQSHVVGPSILGTEYTTAGMSLEDVAVMRHHSEGQEECNRDPDVEEILWRSAHGLATAELASSMCGYTKTGPLKREFPDRTASASASSKKQRLQGMEMDHHSAPPPCHPSLPSKPTPLAVFKRAPFKPPPLITPQVEAIAAPMEPPPSLGSASILMCPTARSTSACRKSEGKVKRDARRRKLQTQDPSRRVEEMRSNGDVDALCFRVSRTGWQGTNLASSQEGRALRNEWYDYSVLFRLTGFETVPYHGLKTRVRDSQGRLWLVRTFVGPRIERLLPFFEEDAAIFVSTVERAKGGFSEGEMEGNARGRHWFSICGHDRNSKSKPSLSAWHITNLKAIDRLWTPGGAVSQIRQCFRKNSPFLPEAPLWAFFQFLLEFCPRRGVCVVFIYGKFNSKERSWLVIWEAGLVVEMPAGVFVMYPSSLFFHFNVDMCDLQFVCTNGALPTEENSSPLDGGDGRGSCVWFNQATMFQSAELGFATVADAQRAGAPCTSNAPSLIDQGLFPVNK
ncbi:hypothetical protein EDB19DRAFT_1916013 [Suillus lakei]|nr:hypothetical protein EDB19DRAFT_1916013 [Suillus lakei]